MFRLQSLGGQTVKKNSFLKMKIFLTKMSKINLFLSDFFAHSRARRPLRDNQFQTLFFWNRVFQRFLEIDWQNVDARISGFKGYPLWSQFE